MADRTSLTNSTARRLGAALLLALLVAIPSRVHAQGYELHVTLRDTAGRGIAGVTVSVRTEGGQELARRATAADGSADFSGLPAIVRIAVEGQPRGGPRLFQLGDDAQGLRVALSLAERPVTLELRAEQDGLVLPDPATMLALEVGGPLVAASEPFPAAAIATPAPLPSDVTDSVTGGAIMVGPGEGMARPGARWAPLVSVLIVAVAAGVMRYLQRRRAAR